MRIIVVVMMSYMCMICVIAMQQDNEVASIINSLSGYVQKKTEENENHKVEAFFLKVQHQESRDYAEFYFSREKDKKGKSSYYGTGSYTSKFGKVLGKCCMTKIECEGSEAKTVYKALKRKYNRQHADGQKKMNVGSRKEKEKHS